MMPHALAFELTTGAPEDRDRFARRTAAVIARNIETILSELHDVLAVRAAHAHPKAWIEYLMDAQEALDKAVMVCAHDAGLVAAE